MNHLIPRWNLALTITTARACGRAMSVVTCLLASTLTVANAAELAADSATQQLDAGASPDELQSVLAVAEKPDELWVAVGTNEFGIYEPDTREIIAYVALYESQQLAVSEVDRILTSDASPLTFTPVTSVSGGSAGSAGSGSSVVAAQSAKGSAGGVGGGSFGGGGSSAGSAGSAGNTGNSAKTSDTPSNSEFSQLLTENHTEFADPIAAVEQFERVSALPDNPELSPTALAKTDGEAGSGFDGANSSLAVPLPSSVWLLLLAPIVLSRPRQKPTVNL